MRLWRASLIVLTVVALAGGIYAPAASASSTINSNTTATLRLATGQSVAVTGSVALTVERFEVDDDSIVLVARLNGQLSGTLLGLPVTATFTNVRVVAAITNLQANCAAGTLSFNYRVTVPTQGISVTIGGISIPLRGAVTLRGSVAISASQIADEDLRAAVGTLICEIEQLLQGGAGFDDVVAVLNAVLSKLP
jgi:hypothetical protein